MDDLMIDRLEILGVTGQQGPITDNIDQSGVAPGKCMDLFERLVCENLPLRAGDTQTILHIFRRFLLIERLNMVDDGDSLPEGPTFRLHQRIVEFILSDEEYVQELGIVSFDIREKSYFLKRVKGQFLSLVNDQ